MASLSACAIPLNAARFDIERGQLSSFKTDNPITIRTPSPTNNRIEILNLTMPYLAKYSVDFDAVNIQAAEMIGDELARNAIVVTNDSKKTIMFTTKRMNWQGGWTRSIYMDFEVETGEGYKRTYKVMGVSGFDLDRALGDAITNAVIKTLQDGNIIKYINKENGKER